MYYYCQCREGKKDAARKLRRVASTDGETCDNCGYYVFISDKPTLENEVKNRVENDERETEDYTEYRVLR